MAKILDVIQSASAPIGAVLGTGLGMATTNWSNNKQYHQQKRLQNLQVRGQKEMADYNQALAMDIWERTNYSAQLAQMEKAGLNVGLMYGHAGQGGTTQGGQGGGVSGGQAEKPDPTRYAGMGLQAGLQVAMMKAQIENINADTKNKLEGAGESGAGADLKRQETANKKIEETILGYKRDLEKNALDISNRTLENVIQTITADMWTAISTAESTGAQAKIDKAVTDDRIKQIKAEAVGSGIKNALMRTEISKNKKQVEEISQRMVAIAQDMQMQIEENQRAWKQQGMDQQTIDQKAQQLVYEKMRTEFGTNWPSYIKQWTSIFTDIISSVSGGGTSGSPTPAGFKYGGN